MHTVEETLATILQAVRVGQVETVALLESLGRVLAEDVQADIHMPPFDNSAVDGYAVRATDTEGATLATPVRLPTRGDSNAGGANPPALEPRTAVRIMTGAMVPPGADAVVMIEDTRQEAGETVAILEAARPEQHVRRIGEDVTQGTVVLRAGTLIRAAEIAMLATMGRAVVPTIRPPRVAILSTGDEVVEIVAGETPPPGKIRNSNRYALAAIVRETGAVVHSLTHLPDDFEATQAALRALTDAAHPNGPPDAIVTAGGVSMGDRDFVRPALEALGTLALWKVAMKPGKPLAFGRIGDTLFFGLPGNPVSALVTFELFARPALWRMAGRPADQLARRQVAALATTDIPHAPGRREYVRAFTTQNGFAFETRPTGAQGSGILRSLTLANSLLVLPEESVGVRAGETVTVLLLD